MQSTDKYEAAHNLKLLVDGQFPRIWMPSSEVRDLRQLLLHCYKLVIMRARVKNELQHLCLNKGVQRKHKLWSKAGQQMLRELSLKPWQNTFVSKLRRDQIEADAEYAILASNVFPSGKKEMCVESDVIIVSP